MKKLSHSLFMYILMLYAFIVGIFILSSSIVYMWGNKEFLSVYKLFFLLLAVFTVVFSKLVTTRVLRPLDTIVEGIYRFQKGDYDHRIRLKNNNELSLVASSLNEMAHNIKGEKNAKRKLELDKDQLVMDISHDLKNPLASILGYSNLLKQNRKELTEDELINYLEIINRNANRANSLITDLFMYNKLEASHYNMVFQKIDVCQFLREVAMVYLPELDEKGFDYNFDIPEKPVFIEANANDLNRAISNLIGNAITYNREGTRLIVKLKEGSCYIQIVIKDNGIGIPKALRETIFNPFKRVDPARNSNTGGSGLGLSITKKIVEIHHGKISLISDAGHGTKFILTIPKIQEECSESH